MKLIERLREKIIAGVNRGREWLTVLLTPVEKRIRFVASTLIMSFIMLVSTVFFFDKAWFFIPLIILAVYLCTFASVLESIEKIEWLTLFIMPVVFSFAMYVFYFLFPVRWITRAPFIGFYAISIYALLLTSNIFNVGVEKSLRLYKAAYSVNFLYQTMLAFLLFSILFSLKEFFFINVLGSAVIGFVLSFHLLWTIKLKLEVTKDLVLYALAVGVLLAEFAAVISFVPFTTTVYALLLSTAYYSISGMVSAHSNNSLFKHVVREHIIVLVVVVIVSILSLSGW